MKPIHDTIQCKQANKKVYCTNTTITYHLLTYLFNTINR